MSFFDSETFTRGGHSWLASRAGTDVPRTGTVKISALPEDVYSSGVIPSGFPVKYGTGDADGYLVPIELGDAPVGFVLGSYPVAGAMDASGVPVGFIWQGAINTQALPVMQFKIPTDPGLFSYVGGNKGTEG